MAAFLGRRYKGILGTGSALGQEGIILPSGAAPTPPPSYNFGNALLTDGVNDYATPSSPINTSATEFVISLWFRSTVSGGGAATGFVATQSTESDALVMANADRVRIKLDGTSYDYSYSWSNDSNWHHYYWYRDSSGALYLCIDGGAANLLSSGASGGVTFDYLFRRGTSNTINLNGTIDDFYFAETTGSAANAASVYNSGNGANPQTVHSNNGVVFYQFNESSGTTAADSSGNGNDLTLTNFTGAYFLPHSYDTDTSVYLATAGITDTTEQAAVNQLVLDLKGTGSTPSSTDLWTDAAAFYPISPTSLSAAAYNLRDTTSFNMTWANSPTHASTGVTFNGTTQYGDTGFNPNTASLANGYDLTLGVQIVNASVTAVGLLSANVSTTSRTQIILVSGSIYQDIHNTAGRLITSTGGTYQGRMIVSADRVANGGKANYLNGSSLGTFNAQDNGTPVNLTLWTGAQNNGSGGQNFTAMELQFALIIPKGIDATAVADLDDAIARYSQTVLEGTLEAETLTYIEDAGITDRGEIAAVNQLVKDLKGTGSTTNNTDVWSDMNAIYPVSPTSLSAAAYNLKDTTSYNITWANSPTHSADGVVGNGSTQYGDTGFNINTDAALDSFGLTVYLNTYNALTSVEIGAYDTAFSQITGYAGGNTLSFLNQAGSGPVSTAGSAAVLTSVRTASNAIALYKNGVSVSTATTASTSKPNGDVYVLARNNIGVGAANLSTKRMAFAAIHAGLTANQAQDLYDAITTYNTALSR